MASEISEDDGYPWLNWALTGVLTLAGVLVAGLVISAWNPRTQTVTVPNVVADVSRPLAQATPSAAAPTSPSVSPPTANSPQPVAAAQAIPVAASAPFSAPKETSSPVAVAKEPSAPAVDAEPAAVIAKDSLPGVTAAAPRAQTPAEDRAVPADSAPVSSPSKASPRSADPKTSEPSPAPESAAAGDKPNPEPVAAKEEPAAQDPAKHAAFVRAAAEVRTAMAKRNLAGSKRSLQTAVSNAQSAADQAELERLQTLQDHLEQFWSGVRGAVAKLQPTDEIVLSESNRVAVIDASSTELAVQREGRPQRYRIEALPMDLLSAIAKTSFKPTSGSKLIVGSFLAMDAQGDRREAGKLWQDAIRSGEPDGKSLLPELNVPRAGNPGRGKR